MQIHDLPIPTKTEEMGWTLGAKLGTVVVVSHRNKKIMDEHLRVRVEHKVDEPLRKYINTTPAGSTNWIHFDVKYKNNLISVCAMALWGIPRQSSVVSLVSNGGPSPPTLGRWCFGRRRMLRGLRPGVSSTLEGCRSSGGADMATKARLLKKVITAVMTAVKNLMVVAAAPLFEDEENGRGDALLGSRCSQVGSLMLTNDKH